MDVGINYKEHDVAKEIMRLTDKKGVNLVVDSVGGSTLQGSINSLAYRGRVADEDAHCVAKLRRAGAEVLVINASPDGYNINKNAGSTHPEQLQAMVKATDAVMGVARGLIGRSP